MNDYVQTVTDAARSLKLLDDAGKLIPLDSLSVLDLITEIEARTQITVPTADIRADIFESVASVAGLLARLSTSAR
jgi:acyl carrier protein